MKFAPLPTTIKRHVVRALACFDTPSEVVRQVREQFNVQITRASAQRYDPTRVAGETLSEELRTLFFDTRERFIEELEKLPRAHRATRLRRLESVYDEARDKGDRKSALAALALAAREMEPFTYADDDDGTDPKGEQS